MRALAGTAVAVWLGVMGCFAFIVAPIAFGALEREAAGRLVGAIFPRYYMVGAVLGLVALVGLIGARLQPGGRAGGWLPLLLALAMLALTLYAWLVVLPAAQAARDAMRAAPAGMAPVEAASFARLHRLSTILNGLVMLAGLIFVVLEGARRS